tara:strand:- start:10280 stop:11101 length:822 start_codon:yes stop_codon:yes gene_type:complete
MGENIFNLEKGLYVVTGGLGLLGKMHCEAIAEFGGTPVIFDISNLGFQEFSEYIFNKTSKKPIFIKVDITDSKTIENAVDILSLNELPILGLINNAARNPTVSSHGLKNTNRLEGFDLDEWKKDIDVGLTGSFLCAKIIGTLMSKNKGGSIINISSDLGIIGPNQDLYKIKNLNPNEQPVKPISYSVVKSGLIGLTRYIATYWPTKVRCNCLCPGGVLTEQSADFLGRINKLIPMRRMANADEYKGSIIYLLSSASSYMTGSIISIDGGRTVW